MILEIDCGNTYIKWRILASNKVLLQNKAQTVNEAITSIKNTKCKICNCRLVSVRSRIETEYLLDELHIFVVEQVIEVRSERKLNLIINGYQAPNKLGSDRLVAMVGAYHHQFNKLTAAYSSVLIIDIGTAITCDLVDKNGRHLGGVIAPGFNALQTSLVKSTAGIKQSIVDDLYNLEASTYLHLGRNTQECLKFGCNSMVSSFINYQIEQAQHLIQDVKVIITGGGSSYIYAKDGIHSGLSSKADIIMVPDLIFFGLSVICPF